MHDFRRRSNLTDDSSRWLNKYPAHLACIWRLPSGESFSLPPIRHDDEALEVALILRRFAPASLVDAGVRKDLQLDARVALQ